MGANQAKIPPMLPVAVAGAVIVVNNRYLTGEREDKSTPLAKQLLEKYRVNVTNTALVGEDITEISNAIQTAIDSGAQVILTCGGTGHTETDLTPEATEPFIEVRLDGVAWQICQAGLANTPLASLSRGLVGITQRGPKGALIVNSPGSSGGIKDTVGVIGPILPAIMEQLDPKTYHWK